MSNKIAVRCVELGIEFDSIGDASKAFGNYDSTSNISNCIKGRTNTPTDTIGFPLNLSNAKGRIRRTKILLCVGSVIGQHISQSSHALGQQDLSLSMGGKPKKYLETNQE